jgi:hypothetical protein
MDLPEPPSADAPHAYATVGVGLPALAHAEVGVWVHPRVAVEARVSWVVFNPMVGLAVDGAVWSSTGGARGHAVTATVEGMLNPTLAPVRLTSGGETLGAYAGIYGGYRWIADNGFTVRVQGGAILYAEGGFAAAPAVMVGVGWAL